MTRKLRIAAAATLTAGALGLLYAGPAAADDIWTEIPSGTSNQITAIEYQGDDRFWFTTSDGEIYRRVGAGFQNGMPASAVSFTDIEFLPGTQNGIASGQAGEVWYSTNGGISWAPGTKPAQLPTDPDCGFPGEIGDISRVTFARNGLAFAFGDFREILKSTDNGATWVDGNVDAGSSTCPINHELESAFWLADGKTGYFSGAGTIKSSDSLLPNTISTRPVSACSGDGCDLVGDPTSQNHQWSQEHGYLYWSDDAWQSYHGVQIGNPKARALAQVNDMDGMPGAFIGAGEQGEVLTSTDGRTYYHQTDSVRDGVNWSAVSVASTTKAALGGPGGVLLTTDKANFTPDVIAPKVAITGPTELPGPGAAAFNAGMTDEGGSGVDDSAITWTVTGAGSFSATGPNAAFTLATPGSYSIRVKANDKAGNESDEDFHSIFVRTPVIPPVTKFDPRGNEREFFNAPGSKPPAATTKGKGKKKKTTINIRGVLGVPASANRAVACSGNVTITITHNKRLIPGAIGKAKVVPGTCKYSKKITFLRSRVKGKPPKITVTLEFPGNSLVAFSQYKKQMTLKK